MLAAALTVLLAATIGAARLAECAGKALGEAQAVQICGLSAAMKTAALSAREASSGLRSLTHLGAGEEARRRIAAAARMGSTARGSGWRATWTRKKTWHAPRVGRGNRDTRRELGTDHRQLQPKVERHGAPKRPHRRQIDHGRLWQERDASSHAEENSDFL
ncbi:hypothetical protein ERJ75_000513300 [Trypanosoma vivax]|nr:hypothetical protein ERJ75_000513300 [Trypanosoma vivax]